jgi:hypothetical protein
MTPLSRLIPLPAIAMYAFHVTIHARPPAAIASGTAQLNGTNYPTLRVAPELLGSTTFACTFEEAAAALAKLERMYCEPDGSFVWVSSQADEPWQIDGNLYDRNERLLFIDIKGSCPAGEFDRLLKCFGWPETPIMFQLVREAVWLDEAAFRGWCKQNAPST